MKVQSAKVLTSLIALGVGLGVAPAFANKQAVERGKEWNKRAEASKLSSWCTSYVAKGQYDLADDAFNRSIELYKSFDKSNSDLPGWYAMYARHLLQASAKPSIDKKEQQMLRARAKKVLDSGSLIANKFPTTSQQKQTYLLNTIEGYKLAGMRAEGEEQIEAVQSDLSELEIDNKLTDQEIIRVAATLRQISSFYCPSPLARVIRMISPYQVVSDETPDKPQTVKKSDFKKAENLQLRALAMYNKLPEGDVIRVEAQRSIVLWYHLYGQTKQEEFQTQQLSKLMHTTDRDKLFPQPAPCPACGMG